MTSKLPHDFPRASFWVEVSKDMGDFICARLFSARGFISSITKRGDKDKIISDLINSSSMLAGKTISIHDV